MINEIFPLIIVYFAVIDPIGTIPIYLSVTENFTYKTKTKNCVPWMFSSFFVLVFFGIFGDLILGHLGISPASFNVAGGAILFLISVEMVNGRRQARKSKVVKNNERISEDIIRISASPIAVPLLAGPGAITSVMIFGDFRSIDSATINISAISFALILSAALLYLSAWGSRFINLIFQPLCLDWLEYC